MKDRWTRNVTFMLCIATSAFGQNEPIDGLRSNPPGIHALTNARIVIAPGSVIESGTIVFRDERIVDVGPRAAIPPDARIHDLHGLTVYPGFIDLSTTFGMPKPPSAQGQGGEASGNQKTPGPIDWNAKSLSHVNASELFTVDEKGAEKLRSQGIVLALTHYSTGIFSGTSALVTTGDGSPREAIKRHRVAQVVSFSQSGSFLSGYPNSLMGIIAHIRQTFSDAAWYGQALEANRRDPIGTVPPESNSSLAALADAVAGRIPVIFSASDELNLLRARKIGREFSLRVWIDGSGKEFRRLEAVRTSGLPVIVPVEFYEKPSVSTPEEALGVTLEDLLEWDIAPENASRLEKAGVTIALTTRGLKDAGTFLSRVRTAIERGLPEDAALAALTLTPAKLLGVDKLYGTVERGKTASFIVSDGSVFGEKNAVREVWVEGNRYEVHVPPVVDVRGEWQISLTTPVMTTTGTLLFKGEREKLSGTMKTALGEVSLSSVTYTADRLTFNARTDTAKDAKHVRQFSGSVSDSSMWGVWQTTEEEGSGRVNTWTAAKSGGASEAEEKREKKPKDMALYDVVYPLGAFGRGARPPMPETILFTGGTVWTMGPEGTLDTADVLIRRGKILQVGRGIEPPSGAVIVDATGKHVTPGLFDAHSHTAVSGSVNEGGQAITAEVRIADVLDPDNIWIYRQLAGGTIGANILHGSANPIGGQNAVVKWRWGANPDDLLIAGAPQGVKFALGENVKRSHFTVQGRPARYPRTRMGVEQLLRDRFQSAVEYEREMKEWETKKSGVPPRRDLELEAISEMVKGTRLIHAHSYRQDEILMLLRVAEDFGIRIATLQHILEGYKVADAIAKHGAGASGFSDWWAYKWEAYEAIPGNIPLMHKEGVLVSYNSDDSQLATRLNWEAAKGLEYGLTPVEALATVTINPARQLGIDKMTGSLEPEKDADIVVWSGNPLSTQTKCLQTWVDGRKYFDVEEDRSMQVEQDKKRAALIERVLADQKSGEPVPGAPRTLRRPGEDFIESCKTEVGHE